MVCILPCCPCHVSADAVPFVPMPQMSVQTAGSFESILEQAPPFTYGDESFESILEQAPPFTYGDESTVDGIGKQVQSLTQVLRLVLGANP